VLSPHSLMCGLRWNVMISGCLASCVCVGAAPGVDYYVGVSLLLLRRCLLRRVSCCLFLFLVLVFLTCWPVQQRLRHCRAEWRSTSSSRLPTLRQHKLHSRQRNTVILPRKGYPKFTFLLGMMKWDWCLPSECY